MPGDDTLVRPDYSECDFVEVRARNDAAGSPYQVATGGNLQCLWWMRALTRPRKPLGSAQLDNASIVTDLVLRTLEYSDNRGPIVSCADPYPTHQMVASWSPDTDDWYYPKDMGIDLGRGLYMLEVHYDNKGSTASDSSGMRICTSKKLRPRTASMSWLRYRNFAVPLAADARVVNPARRPRHMRGRLDAYGL